MMRKLDQALEKNKQLITEISILEKNMDELTPKLDLK